MTAYLLDTNHASAMLKKNAALLGRIQNAGVATELGVPLPVIAELWFMVFNSSRVQRNAEDLDRLLIGLLRWEFSEDAAKEFGRIKAEIRRSGFMIPDADIQIAAIARVNDMVVLTADKHFGYIANLRIENWTR
jgi:tRNA(fMet)-specific endonuclease VapC